MQIKNQTHETCNRKHFLLVLGIAVVLLVRTAFAFDPNTLPVLDPDVAAVTQYTALENRELLTAISDKVCAAAGNAGARAHWNDQMLALLIGDSSVDAKAFALRQLGQIGFPESAVFMGDYLEDEQLSMWARGALEKINTPGAAAQLIRALDKLDGSVKIGVIHSLGAMRAERAVRPLARQMQQAGAEEIRAIMNALGKIGNEAAIEVLSENLNANKRVASTAAAEALLAWASREIATGDPQSKQNLLKSLQTNAALPTAVRQGALVQIMRSEPEAGFEAVRQLILKEDARSAAFAMRFVREAGKPALTLEFAALLDEASSATQVLLLTALADRGDAAALPAVRKRADAGDGFVRVAAVQALAGLGSGEDVPALIKLAADDSTATLQAAARETLAVMRGDLDTVISSAATTPAEQAEARRALEARQAMNEETSQKASIADAGSSQTGTLVPGGSQLEKSSDTQMRIGGQRPESKPGDSAK